MTLSTFANKSQHAGAGSMTFRVNYSIIFVSDMKRSIEFYRDVIGITVKFESPGWTEFETVGATLALHLTDADQQDSPITASEIPGTCRAGFQVPDIDEFHNRMIQHSVRCAKEPTTTFGVRIAQYVDPDGLVFSVSGAV